ncbi:hypothetical protein DMENIID0001_097330 [Sergentomyia squamirostris]
MDDSRKYLYAAAVELPNSSPAVEALKAYYMQKSNPPGLTASASSDQKQNFSTTCTNCLSPWTIGPQNLSLKPSKKPKKRTRNFVIKHYKDKKNAKLRRLSRKLALKQFSSMELTCKICKNITRVPMIKSSKKNAVKPEKKSKESSAVKRLQDTPPAGPPSKKKKKKKRDAFAGLNKAAILAVQAKANKSEAPRVSRPNIGKLASILQKKATISGNSLDKMLK